MSKLLQVSRPTRVHAAEWTRVTFVPDGNAPGTGIRRQYGDVDANAIGVGYCADKTARRIFQLELYRLDLVANDA